MVKDRSSNNVNAALLGMFIGDALAMPAHWYYNTAALKNDYGRISDYLNPKNPHPDSILWRSVYVPLNKDLDILHEQAKYWGLRDIHYHQHLKAGENTLNLSIARELLLFLKKEGNYHPEYWLSHFIDFLTTPGNHRDTYAEEYLRHFFTLLAQGKQPLKCGRTDEKHIGGYTQMLPVLLYFADTPKLANSLSLSHLALTHGGHLMEKWGGLIASIMNMLLAGHSILDSLHRANVEAGELLDLDFLYHSLDFKDNVVVGKHFSNACYVDHAVPATIYLLIKYRDNPEQGLIENIMCGGDNAGRGALLGALLGAACGLEAWPARWIEGLVNPPPTL